MMCVCVQRKKDVQNVGETARLSAKRMFHRLQREILIDLLQERESSGSC